MTTDPRLFHRDEGSGPAVVLIHGLASQTRIWDDVIAQGSSRWRFISVDLPRSGRSKDWAASNPVAIAEGLAALLEKKDVKQYAVVGHSFGGLAALELAGRFPKRVRQCVVASTPALGLTSELRQFVEAPGAADAALQVLKRLPPFSFAVKAYFQFLWAEPNRLTPRHVEIYTEALKAHDVWGGMLDAARAISQYRLPVQVLRESGVPFRVLWGDRDRLVPLLQGEHLATTLQVPFTVLPKTGHCVPEERPEAVLEALGTP